MNVDFNELSAFWLGAGKHNTADEGVCAMEAVAWLEGLSHSDAPACTCPVIAVFVRVLNDAMSDFQRQQLIPRLPRLIGTVSPEHELQRANYLAWHAITVIAPDALDTICLSKHAEKMRALPFHDWIDAANAAFDAHCAAAKAANDCAAYAAAHAYDAAKAANDCAAAKAAHAYAAPHAAYAPHAAHAAAYAAHAVHAAVHAADAVRDWTPALRMLDGVLAIGPQSRGLSPGVAKRIAAYRELVREEG